MSSSGNESLPQTLDWYRQTTNWIALAASALLGIEANALKQIESLGSAAKGCVAFSAVALLVSILAAIGVFVYLSKYANKLEFYNRGRRKLDNALSLKEEQKIRRSLADIRRTRVFPRMMYWLCFQVMLCALACGALFGTLAILAAATHDKSEPPSVTWNQKNIRALVRKIAASPEVNDLFYRSPGFSPFDISQIVTDITAQPEVIELFRSIGKDERQAPPPEGYATWGEWLAAMDASLDGIGDTSIGENVKLSLQGGTK